MNGIISAWGRILAGYTPALSIEITRECPLHCPGCYAYGDDHLGGEMTLREVRDFKGQELVDGVMALVERHKPLHVSIVGGEPLVRYRELEQIIPALSARGIHTQLVTSAVREIPKAFATLAAHDDRRVDRRPAARARRAPHAGHLRPHPQAHRRTDDHGALHGHAAAGQPAGIPRGVPALLVRPSRGAQDLDQPLYAADRRDLRRAADAGRSAAGGRAT